MGAVRVAINGFGRIGRMVFRIMMDDPRFDVVLINDLHPPEVLAYLLKYDSVHGQLNGDVKASDNFLYCGSTRVQCCTEREPKNLPHLEIMTAVVVECTGLFTDIEGSSGHIAAGASRVLISAPSRDAPMYVMGVNEKNYHPDQKIVSNASCTTNCLAPIVKVLNDEFGINEALMTTIHAATSSQPTVDSPVKGDFRGGRSAMHNIIPSSTGAAKAVGKVMPELDGKLTGMAFRVPTLDVSVVDLTVRLDKGVSGDDLAAAMRHASEDSLSGILGYTEGSEVSTDFIGCTLSSVYDRYAGIELNQHFHKVIAWYDNEMGYAARVCDLVRHITSTD